MVAGPEAGDQHLARDWPGEKKKINNNNRCITVRVHNIISIRDSQPSWARTVHMIRYKMLYYISRTGGLVYNTHIHVYT